VVEAVAILEAFRDSGHGADLWKMLRAVRARLRPILAGNAPGTERLVLPEAVEASLLAALTGEGDKRCLAPTPEDTQEALAQIRNMVDGRHAAALVAQSADLRPHLRRLTALEFPYLAVLAAEELLPE